MRIRPLTRTTLASLSFAVMLSSITPSRPGIFCSRRRFVRRRIPLKILVIDEVHCGPVRLAGGQNLDGVSPNPIVKALVSAPVEAGEQVAIHQ
jgi:hypothetical protein